MLSSYFSKAKHILMWNLHLLPGFIEELIVTKGNFNRFQEYQKVPLVQEHSFKKLEEEGKRCNKQNCNQAEFLQIPSDFRNI